MSQLAPRTKRIMAWASLAGHIESSTALTGERIKTGQVVCDEWLEELRRLAANFDAAFEITEGA